ncbi:hypothetical protein [Streptomyces sp. NBC_00829]|uniref:hypothetical protein n=1 Tax=Streptomyces sp. NBC_00829 TaxID=2903679 RepID=UPI003864D519|nr:hypothetical protein OG293_14375 [Streptomyces sp. NBC_00829]
MLRLFRRTHAENPRTLNERDYTVNSDIDRPSSAPASHRRPAERSSRLGLTLAGAAAVAFLGSGAAFASGQAPAGDTGTAASSPEQHTQKDAGKGSDDLRAAGVTALGIPGFDPDHRPPLAKSAENPFKTNNYFPWWQA